MKLTVQQEGLINELADTYLDQIFLENAYLDFQRAELKKRGLSSPFQIKDPKERKKFFQDVSKGWALHKASLNK